MKKEKDKRGETNLKMEGKKKSTKWNEHKNRLKN